MLLSASYNYFNGDEHFLASLRAIRSEIDHISVIWQEKSNAGEMITDRALQALDEAKHLQLVDTVIHFEPNLKCKRRINELEKREIGLDSARSAGATHFLSLDTDEFYREHEIAAAKIQIEQHSWKSTSVGTFMHLIRPIYRSKDTTCCCFITQIESETRIGVPEFPCDNVDSTRRMTASAETHHHFDSDLIAMYHMNLVRLDLQQKLRNSSTVNKKFLRQVERALSSWSPGLNFHFPEKGVFTVSEVPNEFDTYDPGSAEASSKKSSWMDRLGLRPVSRKARKD